MTYIHRLYEWLTMRDVDKAIDYARTSTAKRFGRGNTNFQNGYILDEDGMDCVRRKGDLAIKELVAQQKACIDDEQGGIRR